MPQWLFGVFCLGLISLVHSQPLRLSPLSVPQRIVSLNICIDLLLWDLVPRQRLVSLSYLSAQPAWSPIAGQLGSTPLNHGLAEEIMPLNPDIVLAGEFDGVDAVTLLQRLGIRVERLRMPRKLDEISGQIMELARLVDAEPKARLMTEKIAAQLAELEQAQIIPSLTAVWYTANGVVIGADTLEHELMIRAGLRNLAAEQGLQGFAPLDLEQIIVAKPQILLVEEGNDGTYSLAQDYLSHPALRSHNFKIVRLPTGLSGCAASSLNDVLRALHSGLGAAANAR